MSKDRLFKYIGFTLLLLGSLGIPVQEDKWEETMMQSAGINGKHVQQGTKAAKKGWGWLRACAGCKGEAEQIAKNKEMERILENMRRSKRLLVVTEMLGKNLGEAKAQEEVLPRIEEYLSQTNSGDGGRKIINCIRTEGNKMKMLLYEQGNSKPTRDKVIKIASETINLAEYEVRAMQENFYKGLDGIEYVEFIIPRKPEYILNGKYQSRIYECMVFNIPKDINGNWRKFKEYLIAFINDIMVRPAQLWDEYRFRQGLTKLDIDLRDVNEMERYLFALITNTIIEYETVESIQKEIA